MDGIEKRHGWQARATSQRVKPERQARASSQSIKPEQQTKPTNKKKAS